MNLSTKQKQTDRLGERMYGYQGGMMGDGMARDLGVDMYTLRCVEWVTNKDLLCSAGSSAQCSVAAWMGGESGGEWRHVCVYTAESLCCAPETITTL